MRKAKRNRFRNPWRLTAVMSVVRFSMVTAGIAIAGQALGIIPAPQVVFAEASSQQRLPKKVAANYSYKYSMKIREALDSQKDFGDPVLALQTLDRLCNKIEKKISPNSKLDKEKTIEALNVISRVLKEEGNFEYRKNMLLIEGLKRQKNGKRFIDCDDYSSIYLITGERLGLHLVPVYADKHVFLKCRLYNNTHFFWEPTIAAEKDIGFYQDWLNIAKENGYPKVLNEIEFEAIHFCNLGVAWYEEGDFERAIEHYKRALWLNPNYEAAYNNLGVAYAKQGDFGKAIECYKKAAILKPNFAAAYNNTGVAFYKLGYLEKAIEYFEKANDADPKYSRANDYKIAVLVKMGEREKAFKFIKEIQEKKRKASTS